jgi:hypothetical protein
VLRTGIKFLLECARHEDDKVSWWSGRNPAAGHVYFTYTAVIALREFLESNEGKGEEQLSAEVETLFPKVKDWLVAWYNGKRWPESPRTPLETHIIYTIYGLLTLLALRVQNDNKVKSIMKAATEEIITEWNKGTSPEMVNEFFEEVSHDLPFRAGPHRIGYEDRSTLCVGLSALARTYDLSLLDRKELDGPTNSMFAYLRNDRLDDGTWYRPDFEFYYTQRAIEAVTDFAKYVPEIEIRITEKNLINALLKVLQDQQFIKLVVNEIKEKSDNASEFRLSLFDEAKMEIKRASRESQQK